LMSASRWIRRRRWDLARFGVTPRGVLHRLRPPAGAPRVLAISIPKAGTHALERLLCLHPLLHRRLTRKVFPAQLGRLDDLLGKQRPGEVLCAHLHYNRQSERVVSSHSPATLFIVRDPRDIVVSQAYYTYRWKGHQWHERVKDLPDPRDRMRLFIEGDPRAGIASIGEVLELYRGWLDRCAVVRYEDLVDPTRRLEEIARIYTHLGVSLPDGAVRRVAGELVSDVSVTFRAGRTGDWRQEFDERLERLFIERVGPSLAEFGYASEPPAQP